MQIRIILTFLFLLSIAINASAQPTELPQVEILNLQTSYKWFNEITPIIANQTGQKIYSYHLGWGLQLIRFNEMTGQWEKGRIGFRDGVMAHNASATSHKPIESGQKLPFTVNCQYAVRWNAKTASPMFRLENAAERPLVGKYKLLFNYAYQTWDSPSEIPLHPMSVTSSVFTLVL